jgi:hypothetical protein
MLDDKYIFCDCDAWRRGCKQAGGLDYPANVPAHSYRTNVTCGAFFELMTFSHCPYCGVPIREITVKGSVVDSWDDDYGLSAGAEQDYECRYDCALRPAA